MLTSLEVKAAVSSEDVVAILGTSCRLVKEAVSGRRQVDAATRRTNALE